VPVPEPIQLAVGALSKESGYEFRVSDAPVEGTKLFLVYATEHPLSDLYNVREGILGFRVPDNYPDACPEDSFFIQPADIKLTSPDAVRNSVDIHRAGPTPEFLKGTELGATPALVFSWHIWNTRPWNRSTHTLIDHYAHCVRRFDAPEHD